MDVLNTKCGLSKKSKINLEDLNKVIAVLKKKGVIDRILKSYQ